MSVDTAQARRLVPDLSVVAVTRNDDHGINMRGRMQHFVNGFIAQCRRHQLNAELILVEWNPPANRLSLEDVLDWPADFGPAEVRIIKVPPDVHAQFAHSESVPLFQMIGKNVGIRRARARFVLATNVDILFDDALIRYMRDRPESGTMLRIDRYDVPSDVVTGVPFEQVLSDCAARFFQVQTRYGVFDVRERRLRGMSSSLEASIMSMVLGLRILGKPFRTPSRRWSDTIFGHCGIAAAILSSLVQHMVRTVIRHIRFIAPLQRLPIRIYYLVRRLAAFFGRFVRLGKSAVMRLLRIVRLGAPELLAMARLRRSRWLHTNGCGDFILLSREDWFRLRGYAEWPVFSWHLDSLFMYAANANGIREIALNESYRIYHIDHSEGWSPDGEKALFSQLNAKGIPFLSNKELHQWQTTFADDPRSAIINAENWGLCDYELFERKMQPRKKVDSMLKIN